MNKDIGNLFLSLEQKDKSYVTNMLLDIALCIEFDTSYGKILTKAKAETKGKTNKLITIIYKFSKAELDRVAGFLVEYKWVEKQQGKNREEERKDKKERNKKINYSLSLEGAF